MPFSHFCCALLVIIAWGLNFIFVKLGLEEIPPLLLCALRFLISSIPAIFFIKPPSVPFRAVAYYGLVMFALQFGCVFLGMKVGMTPGVASLLMQVQVFFSMIFAMAFLGESFSIWQVTGAVLSFTGIGLVSMHFDRDVSLIGFTFILAAAAAWGVGNLIAKKMQKINMMSLVVWASFIACLPMFLISLLFEGPSAYGFVYTHLTWKGVFSVCYIVYISTWLGYGVWNWLLSRYHVGVVAPFSLLVPVVGMLGSSLVLGETLPSWKLMAAFLVMAGVGINLLSARLSRSEELKAA